MRRNPWALALALVPVAFTVAFTVLGLSFEYPGILRKPVEVVLEKFRNGEDIILPAWWLMLVSAAAFVPVSAAIIRMVHFKKSQDAVVALGIAAGIVQSLGLARWTFAVPYLAHLAPTPSMKPFAHAMFNMLNSYMGAGIGEFLGYLFTGSWTILVSLGLIGSEQGGAKMRRPLGLVGVLLGIGIIVGCLEPSGLTIAGPVNAIAYLAWSVWMVVLGISLYMAPTAPDSRRSSLP